MSYQPSLDNWQTCRRLEKAFLFANSYFKIIEAKPCSIKLITKYFGNPHRGLGKWLLKNLIIEDSGYYNADSGVCKSYTLNPGVAAWIMDNVSSEYYSATDSIIEYNKWIEQNPNHYFRAVTTGDIYDHSKDDISVPVNLPLLAQPVYQYGTQKEFVTARTVELYSEEYNTELTTGNFTYSDKKNRYWHDLQNVKRDLKKAVLEHNGYLYHYDISTAAPTLLLQIAKRHGDFNTPTIDALLRHKRLFRNMISRGLGIDNKKTKQLISSLFYGARISNHPRRAIMKLVQSTQAIVLLKQSRLIKRLRREINLMWRHLDQYFTRTQYTTKNGQVRTRQLTASQKSMFYFQNEQDILKVVRRVMRTKRVRVFLEHDGWSTNTYVDPYELTLAIQRALGIRVLLEMEIGQVKESEYV